MRSVALNVLIGLAVLVGMFASQIELGAGSSPVGQADAMMMGSGTWQPECGGGVKAICRRCDHQKCVVACEGDYSCSIERNKDNQITGCSFSPTACTSGKPVPDDPGLLSW